MRYPTRGYQTRSRASNQTRHEGAGLPEDDIENGPILGAESGDGAIMPLDRKIYISALKGEPLKIRVLASVPAGSFEAFHPPWGGCAG